MIQSLQNPQNPLASLAPDVQAQAVAILSRLYLLGFEAKFARLEEGPILRTFYLKPELHSIYAKALNKEEEVAGVLGVESVRIYRAEGLLAIEVPQANRKVIRFDACVHQLFTSPASQSMVLPILMGVNPKGEYLYADLAQQPHLLVAGSTGSGKSVFTSMVLGSLALFKPPSELQITVVDTKNLDLVLFRGLAHIKETITEVAVLRSALEQLLVEVRLRTSSLSGVARNLQEYNKIATAVCMQYPYKLLVIDELADVLATDAALRASMTRDERADNPSIASLLQRLTQISRAVGIHVVMATQRPSIKMVTGDSQVGFGDLKANFPARICFKLPTMADSRVVLDENGAESLLGRGDYLYKIAGSDEVRRAHSAYVSMEDIALVMAQHDEIRRMYATV